MNLGDDTTTGGRTREGSRASQQTKQKSRSTHIHAGQRATLHRKKEKIRQRREALARKVAATAGQARECEPHHLEASRWREETEEAQSIIDGTHPKLIGLEDEQLEHRKKLLAVPALGNLTYERPDGTFRIMSHQVNNMSTKGVREAKVEQMTLLANRYDADMWGIGEHGINGQRRPASETMASYFDTEVNLRSVSSFNTTEKPKGHYQPGGTAIVATNTLCGHIKNTGVDFRKLGRWSWMLLEGEPGHRTRIIQVYSVGNNRSTELGSAYQQSLRCIQTNDLRSTTSPDDPTTPKDLLTTDLLKQLRTWKMQGDQMIVMMDANDHILTGSLGKALVGQKWDIGLEEISHRAWGDFPPNTYIRGHRPVDGVWASSTLEIVGFKILPFYSSVGDHRGMVFDVTTRSLLGKYEARVEKAGCRRLISSNQGSVDRYNKLVEDQVKRHKLRERLDELDMEMGNDAPTRDQICRADIIFEQIAEIQLHAERKCRKILKPDLEFSSEIKFWHERVNAWRAMSNLRKGNVRHRGHCYRNARSSNIENPKLASDKDIAEGLAYAKAKRKQLKLEAPALRRVQLKTNLLDAITRGDEVQARKLQKKITSERSRKMWFSINRSMKDARGCATMVVQKVMPDGTIVESTSQDNTEKMIFEETECRFQLAMDAPISSTDLIHQLGHLADTDIAKQIVEGDFECPEELDEATIAVLEEIGSMGVELSNGEICVVITPEEFRHFWGRAREGTASSISGIHFGHYKAAAKSELLSGFLAKQVTLIARTGHPPKRWSKGLTVMLEKVAGLALVNKLRAILLMEADFNMHNKIIFGRRMLDAARDAGMIPEEHFSDKEHTAEDGKFSNILMSDLSRQKRQRMCSISADAGNCYDRIHHAIMALVFLALGVPTGAITAMLQSIQLMKFFLRTGWGQSDSYIGGDPLHILHGMCQGNGAAPAAWLVLSAMLIRIYKRRGHGAKLRSPITRCWLSQMGVSFVDDVDLFIIKSCLDTEFKLTTEAQSSLNTWGTTLIETGGVLKPEKCHYHMWGYECIEGKWEQVDLRDHADITVPTAAGESEVIEQLNVGDSMKTLGLYANPAGCCKKQIDVLIDSVQEWTNRLKNSRLPTTWAWVSYRSQLWPKLNYGLGTNMSPVEDLLAIEDTEGDRPAREDDNPKVQRRKLSLRAIYREMLASLGVNRNIRRGWRHIGQVFGGIGLRRLLPEVLMARINLFLQHFRSDTVVGKSLMSTLEHLQLETGFDNCPLNRPYKPLGPFTTRCWIQSLWESLDYCGVELVVDYPTIPKPRVGDKLVADIFIGGECQEGILGSLQRCRRALGVIFLSDMTAANGSSIERRWTKPETPLLRPATHYDFPAEVPTEEDWSRWEHFWLSQFGASLTLPNPMGAWLHKSHRIWEWFYHSREDLVVHIGYERTSVYTRAGRHGGRRSGKNQYQLVRDENTEVPTGGIPCSVGNKMTDVVILLNTGPSLAKEDAMDQTFTQFLLSWGGEWMWNDVSNSGKDFRWVLSALEDGSGLWVTDGSYMRETREDVSGACWIFHCRKTGHKLVGTFYEESDQADSYRGERLGLLAIHLLLAAIVEYFGITVLHTKICCDNEGGLYISSERRLRVKAGASQADIDRVARRISKRLPPGIEYEWVSSHQDSKKAWNELSLEEQLNTECDMRAKGAVTGSLNLAPRVQLEQLLPLEPAAIKVGKSKQTSDPAVGIRAALERKEAERFYRQELGWPTVTFDCVHWDVLRTALESKGDPFRLWLSKQVNGFCGTQTMVAHWDKTRDGSCPDCGTREDAAHLMKCPSLSRTTLLRDQVEDLVQWMDSHDTAASVSFWVSKYILLRNARKLSSFLSLPDELKQFAAEQDAIGWREFTEGRISSELFRVQQNHIEKVQGQISPSRWNKDFITRVLHITQAQWIHRNSSLHQEGSGYLAQQERDLQAKDIERYLETDPKNIPEESKHLVEVDPDELINATTERRSYWLIAMKAARRAGRRIRGNGRRQGSGRQAKRKRQRWADKMKAQLTLGTREVERSIEGWGEAQQPRKNKRKSRAGESAALKSNKRYRKPD